MNARALVKCSQVKYSRVISLLVTSTLSAFKIGSKICCFSSLFIEHRNSVQHILSIATSLHLIGWL